MKKIEFTEKMKMIDAYLQSSKIDYLFNEMLNQKTDQLFTTPVVELLIASKSGYDKLNTISDYQKIFKSLNASEIYDIKNISQITRDTSEKGLLSNLFKDRDLMKFFQFNQLISSLNNNSEIFFGYQNQIKKNEKETFGIIILETANFGNSLSKYANALIKIEKLFELIKMIFHEENEGNFEVLYFESGSATDVVIKTSKKIASAFTQTIHEIWRFISDNSNYREARKDEAIEKKLDLMNKIGEMEKSGKLSKEDSANLKHRLKKQVIDLMEYGVVTREVATSERVVTGRAQINKPQTQYFPKEN